MKKPKSIQPAWFDSQFNSQFNSENIKNIENVELSPTPPQIQIKTQIETQTQIEKENVKIKKSKSEDGDFKKNVNENIGVVVLIGGFETWKDGDNRVWSHRPDLHGRLGWERVGLPAASRWWVRFDFDDLPIIKSKPGDGDNRASSNSPRALRNDLAVRPRKETATGENVLKRLW